MCAEWLMLQIRWQRVYPFLYETLQTMLDWKVESEAMGCLSVWLMINVAE